MWTCIFAKSHGIRIIFLIFLITLNLCEGFRQKPFESIIPWITPIGKANSLLSWIVAPCTKILICIRKPLLWTQMLVLWLLVVCLNHVKVYRRSKSLNALENKSVCVSRAIFVINLLFHWLLIFGCGPQLSEVVMVCLSLCRYSDCWIALYFG